MTKEEYDNNLKETELNKVLNYMKQYVENKYEHDSEPMLTYKDLQLVLDEIERLNNIINESRRILGEYRHYSVPDEIQNSTNEEIVDKAYTKLHSNLEDKGSDKE